MYFPLEEKNEIIDIKKYNPILPVYTKCHFASTISQRINIKQLILPPLFYQYAENSFYVFKQQYRFSNTIFAKRTKNIISFFYFKSISIYKYFIEKNVLFYQYAEMFSCVVKSVMRKNINEDVPWASQQSIKASSLSAITDVVLSQKQSRIAKNNTSLILKNATASLTTSYNKVLNDINDQIEQQNPTNNNIIIKNSNTFAKCTGILMDLKSKLFFLKNELSSYNKCQSGFYDIFIFFDKKSKYNNRIGNKLKEITKDIETFSLNKSENQNIVLLENIKKDLYALHRIKKP